MEMEWVRTRKVPAWLLPCRPRRFLPPRVNVATFACTSVSSPVPERAIISYLCTHRGGPMLWRRSIGPRACTRMRRPRAGIPVVARGPLAGSASDPGMRSIAGENANSGAQRGGTSSTAPRARHFLIGGGKFYEEIALLGDECAIPRESARLCRIFDRGRGRPRNGQVHSLNPGFRRRAPRFDAPVTGRGDGRSPIPAAPDEIAGGISSLYIPCLSHWIWATEYG